MSDACEDQGLCKAMENVLDMFEVSIAEAKSLLILKDYDIIVIADDSGSMRKKDPGMKKSRWDELESSLKLIVSLGACFDEDGIDIYFLNSSTIEGVKSAEDTRLKACFNKIPMGGTKLSKKLAEVVMAREDKVKQIPSLAEKPVLLMIFTDGTPDEGSDAFGNTLGRVLRAESTKLKFRCQLLACTGDDEEIEWARKLDDDLGDLLDMTDDYLTEKKEMEALGGFSQFTEGDWCLKAMLGAVDPTWDAPGAKRDKTGRSKQHGTQGNAEKPGGKMQACLKSLIIMAVIGGVFYVHYTVKHLKEEL